MKNNSKHILLLVAAIGFSGGVLLYKSISEVKAECEPAFLALVKIETIAAANGNQESVDDVDARWPNEADITNGSFAGRTEGKFRYILIESEDN